MYRVYSWSLGSDWSLSRRQTPSSAQRRTESDDTPPPGNSRLGGYRWEVELMKCYREQQQQWCQPCLEHWLQTSRAAATVVEQKSGQSIVCWEKDKLISKGVKAGHLESSIKLACRHCSIKYWVIHRLLPQCLCLSVSGVWIYLGSFVFCIYDPPEASFWGENPPWILRFPLYCTIQYFSPTLTVNVLVFSLHLSLFQLQWKAHLDKGRCLFLAAFMSLNRKLLQQKISLPPRSPPPPPVSS